MLLSKIKSPASLKRILSLSRNHRSKNRGQRIVFSNGCFDLLHKGHVYYLQKARKLGDLLIIAVNSDESVKKLKGPSRPLNLLADRLEVLAALESVDYVTWFEEETPLRLICLLRPDVLVKGGDWKKEDIVGSTEVLSWGGTVRSIKYIEGRSTTALLAMAKEMAS
jgi:D-beta-D-heptose 7-phosphate kinase/D-beta-D-heptose 1-phosphate adenosyltransferase